MKRLALALFAAAALPAAAQEVTLKFHHIWNPQATASTTSSSRCPATPRGASR